MRRRIRLGKNVGGFLKLGGIQSADSGYLIRMNSKNCSDCFVRVHVDLKGKVDFLTETVVYFATRYHPLYDTFTHYNIIPLIFQEYLFPDLPGLAVSGDTREEVVLHAGEYLRDYLADYKQRGEPWPKPPARWAWSCWKWMRPRSRRWRRKRRCDDYALRTVHPRPA